MEFSAIKLVVLIVSLSFTISIGLIMLFEFNDSSTIRNVLKGEILNHTFTTTSTTFVSTGFPANNTFIKKYDDSEIWVFLTLDIRNTGAGRTNFIAISIDKGTKSVLECEFDVRIKGNCATIWAYDFSTSSSIQAFTGVHIEGGLKAGEHTIDLDVAVNGGTGRFQTETAILDVYEVPMERPYIERLQKFVDELNEKL